MQRNPSSHAACNLQKWQVRPPGRVTTAHCREFKKRMVPNVDNQLVRDTFTISKSYGFQLEADCKLNRRKGSLTAFGSPAFAGRKTHSARVSLDFQGLKASAIIACGTRIMAETAISYRWHLQLFQAVSASEGRQNVCA